MKFDDIKSILDRTIEDEEFSYQIHTLITAALYAIIAGVMCLINILLKNTYLAIATGSLTLIAGLSFFYVYKFKDYLIIRNIIATTFIIALIQFLYTGSGEGIVPFWALLLPFMSFFMFGLKKGIIVIMTFFLASIIILWLPFDWLLAYDYSKTFRIRFPIIYFACFVTAGATEVIRFMTRKKLQETVAYLESITWVDTLTQIENRRSFERHISELWEIFISKKNYVSIVMIDIDYFKNYNDAYGHLKGDEALKSVAHVLATTITQDKGFVARWGGEEFICLLPFCDSKQANQIGQSILKAIEDADILHEFTELPSKHITVSAGSATANSTLDINPNDVIRGADESLYEAKNHGRNRLGRNKSYG